MERLVFNYNFPLPSLRLQLRVLKLASLDEVNRNTEAPSLNDLRNQLPQTAVSQLRYEEIVKVFRLKKDRRLAVFDSIQDEEMVSIPKRLDNDLTDIREFLTKDPTNEASSRLRLDSILRSCLRDERAWYTGKSDENRKANLNRLIGTLESDLTIAVKRRGRLELLNSNVDYSVWYDDKSMGTSLVIVRVRNHSAFGAGLKECLAYSAMVHTIRKNNHGQNATVYGVVSDSFEFTFLRIDNDRRWNIWNSPEPWNERSASRIYTLLRLIVHNGPSTSVQCSTEKSKGSDSSGKPLKYRIGFGSSSEEVIGVRGW